jgi:hypothetical protein
MHEALDTLEAALPTADPAAAYSVTHKTLSSAIKVIARADDSSGIIGDACRRLLELHPKVAAAANVAAPKLIDWMMAFQFDGDVDYFTLDPVAYAPALGQTGMAAYRARLAEIEADLGQRPSQADRWRSQHSHEWFTLDWNARRLAVLDRISRRSFAPMPGTDASRPGCRTPPKPSKRSGRPTWRSIGLNRPPISMTATNPAAPPTTGANSSTNTGRTNHCPLAFSSSVVGRRRQWQHVCTPQPAPPGPTIEPKS